MKSIQIIIGTSNANRFKNLRELITEIDPSLQITQSTLKVDERGVTTSENATLKAKAYFQIHHENTLCVDDGLFLENDRYSPGVMVRRNEHGEELSKSELIDKWKAILENTNLPGIMEKSFVLVNKNGEVYRETVQYNIILRNNDNVNKEVNPLNNFIYPDGFSVSISNFSKNDILRFRKPQKQSLIKLIKNLVQ